LKIRAQLFAFPRDHSITDEMVKDGYKSVNHSITLGMEFRAFPRGLMGVRLNYGFHNIVEDPTLVKNFTVRTLTSTMYIAINLVDENR